MAQVFTIRDLSDDDLDALLAIEQSTMDYPWHAGQFQTLFKAGAKGFVLVNAKHADDAKPFTPVIGFLLYLDNGAEIELLNLVIQRDFQRRQYGKRLLQRLLNHARRQSKAIALEVRSSNMPAIHLYECLGFQVVGERADYYPTQTGRENAILMRFSKVPQQNI